SKPTLRYACPPTTPHQHHTLSLHDALPICSRDGSPPFFNAARERGDAPRASSAVSNFGPIFSIIIGSVSIMSAYALARVTTAVSASVRVSSSSVSATAPCMVEAASVSTAQPLGRGEGERREIGRAHV